MLARLAAVTSASSSARSSRARRFARPALLARAAAAVDEIERRPARAWRSAAGWNEEEFRAFGLPFDRRVARFEEAFEHRSGGCSPASA